MAQGQVPVAPADGRTARQRGRTPVVEVHSGAGTQEDHAVDGILRERPGCQPVVRTGRDPRPDLVAAAYLATERTKVAHPCDAGQKGLE